MVKNARRGLGNIMKAFTFKQYRTLNLCMMAILFSVADALITLGATQWFPGLPYVLSLQILYMCLEMMRWRAFGAVAPLVGGLVFCLASHAEPRQFAIYCLGNCFSLLALLFIRGFGRKTVREKTFLTLCYVVLVYLLACTGRFIVSLFFGTDGRMLVQFLTTDILSLVFALVAVFCVRNAEGIFEDQKDYLFRLDREKKEKAQKEMPDVLNELYSTEEEPEEEGL